MEVLRPMKKSILFTSITAFLFFGVFPPEALKCDEVPPSDTPKLEVHGYGFRGNRELRRSIVLLVDEEEIQFYDAPFIEDAAFIILSIMKQDGYLKPTVRVQLILEDGSEEIFHWRESAEVMLQRPKRTSSVRFQVEPGTLYYYEDIDFTGLTLLDEKYAETFFVPDDYLIPLKAPKAFTPEKLNNSLSNLRDTLVEKGYPNASVVAGEVDIDHETGAVSAHIDVAENEKHIVRDLRKEIFYRDSTLPPREELIENTGIPFSRRWLQDTTIKVRNRFLQKGYPDVEVESRLKHEEMNEDYVAVDLSLRIDTGPKVYLADIVFEGAEKTRESVLKRRARIQPGQVLNRVELQDVRYRLARLGVFESVDLDYEEVAPDRRIAIFKLKEGKEIEAAVLIGYGSYEMLRGGLELVQHNVFGRAHRSRLQAVQSMKASSVEYRYTMPELMGRDINVFTNISALRRKEIDFVRKEYGASLGLLSYSTLINSDVSVRYIYQLLDSGRFEAAEQYGMDRAQVGAFQFDVSHDSRNNPISPREGYKLSKSIEIAAPAFLGNSNYQKLDLTGSWHKGIGRGVYFNAGLKHGLIISSGSSQNNLPFSKRFFPGGGNSVRGYQHGEASPRDEENNFIGAETYSLLNVELEQMITPSWSLVLFTDGLAMSKRFRNYPYDETLYSIGGGVRYNTFMGPLRVEYGYNPKRRPGDPAGTLHISLGTPF